MATTTRTLTETRKRGFFGHVFNLLFWCWNLFMIWAILKGLSDGSPQYNALQGDEKQAYAAGAGLAIMAELFMWAIGSVVFGMLAYFTRGKRVMVETIHGQAPVAQVPTVQAGAAGEASGSTP